MLTAEESERGACHGIWRTNPELHACFFHESSEAARRRAKALCAECPIKERCLEEALNDNEVFGVWGGTGRRDRELLRRARR